MHTYVSQWGISVLRQTMLQLLRNTHCYPDTVNASVRVAVNWGKVGPFVSQCRGHMITRTGCHDLRDNTLPVVLSSELWAPKSDCSLGSGPYYLRVNFIKQFPGTHPLEVQILCAEVFSYLRLPQQPTEITLQKQTCLAIILPLSPDCCLMLCLHTHRASFCHPRACFCKKVPRSQASCKSSVQFNILTPQR